MVLDLDVSNSFPQSSTSSCTDYFFDGCHSKSRNNCQTQKRNCQCRPCCINSMINDHTYSLIKKICRKIMRDCHRQQSREKYTIFDGGNSINVRIHRSSFVPGEDGKCKPTMDDSNFSKRKGGVVLDQIKGESISGRSTNNQRKKKGRYDVDGDDVGAKTLGRKEKARKSYPIDYETSNARRSKRVKGRGSENDDYGDDNRKRRKNKKGKGEGGNDHYDNEKPEKGRKVKASGYDEEEDVSAKQEKGTKGTKKKDRDNSSGKEAQDKDKRGKGERHGGTNEDEDIKTYRKKGKSQTIKSVDSIYKRDYKSDKRKTVETKIDGSVDNDKMDGGTLDYKLGKQRRGGESFNDDVARHGKEKLNKIRGIQNGEDKKGGTRIVAKSVKNKIEDSFEGRANEVYTKGKKDGGRKADTITNNGYRLEKGSGKKERYFGFKDEPDGNENDRRHPSHKGDRLDLSRGSNSASRKGYRKDKGDDHKSTSFKNKGISGIPVISNLRAKVRKDHDVMPIPKIKTGKYSYRSSLFQEQGRKMRSRDGDSIKLRTRRQKHINKISKDRINERLESRISGRKSRRSRGLGGLMVPYNGYGSWMPSRCDEIRPCDVLRAHMEQRELCERRRSCLPCPCDCSVIYTQTPHTLCTCLH